MTQNAVGVQTDSTKTSNAGGMLVVELGKKQKSKRIKQLREGQGQLFDEISSMIGELKEQGAIGSNAQPIVIVVEKKKKRLLGW